MLIIARTTRVQTVVMNSDSNTQVLTLSLWIVSYHDTPLCWRYT